MPYSGTPLKPASTPLHTFPKGWGSKWWLMWEGWAKMSQLSHSCRLCSGALDSVWLSPELGWNETFSTKVKRIISAAGTGSGILLILALTMRSQKQKQRHCADNTLHRTHPARLPKKWQGHPCLERDTTSAFSTTRAQLLHINSVWDQSLLPSAHRHQQRCWKGQMSRRCCLKLIKMQAQVLSRSTRKLGPTKKPTYLELENYHREKKAKH